MKLTEEQKQIKKPKQKGLTIRVYLLDPETAPEEYRADVEKRNKRLFRYLNKHDYIVDQYHPEIAHIQCEDKCDSLLQKEREAGRRDGIEEGGYGGRMEAMNLLIERYKDNGWLVNDLNDIKSGKVKKLARLSLWSEGNDRLKSVLVEKSNSLQE